MKIQNMNIDERESFIVERINYVTNTLVSQLSKVNNIKVIYRLNIVHIFSDIKYDIKISIQPVEHPNGWYCNIEISSDLSNKYNLDDTLFRCTFPLDYDYEAISLRNEIYSRIKLHDMKEFNDY